MRGALQFPEAGPLLRLLARVQLLAPQVQDVLRTHGKSPSLTAQ